MNKHHTSSSFDVLYKARSPRGPYNRWRTLIVAMLLSALFLIFTPHTAGGVLAWAARPLWKLEDMLGRTIEPFLASVADAELLRSETHRLTDELREKNNALHERDQLLGIYKELASLFRRTPPQTDQHIYAIVGILARPPRSPYDTLLLDAGLDRDIRVHDVALAGENIALGEVVEVYAKTAKVVLYSSAGQEQPVFVGEHTGEAVAVGRGGGMLEIQLPLALSVQKGELLTTQAKRFSVGVTLATTQIEGESFQMIRARIPVNIQELSWIALYR